MCLNNELHKIVGLTLIVNVDDKYLAIDELKVGLI